MAGFTGQARAKVNLTLDILGRMPDGYHEISSVMHTVKLADIVEVKLVPGGEIRVSCSGKHPAPDGEGNVAHKAAILFRQALKAAGGNTSWGVEITIDKRIPPEAGLGGGSADAAAVLNLLNAATGQAVNDDLLAEIACKAGSDVPFLLKGGAFTVGGAGESMGEIEGSSGIDGIVIAIAKPSRGLSTSFMYAEWDKEHKGCRNSGLTTQAFLRELKARGARSALKEMGNDFEAIAEKHLPEVSAIKAMMIGQGAIASCMTGSGSAVFGAFEDEDRAIKAVRRIEESIYGAFTAVTALDARRSKHSVCEVV